MKKSILIIFLALATALNFTSCKNNDDDDDDNKNVKPVITLNELGYQNTKIGYPGSDLHIEADIFAENKIRTITVTVHPEGTTSKEWEVDTTYTSSKYAGVKNAEFHEHLEIPIDAGLGDYHFHLSVIDNEGNQTEVEEELEIAEPTDTELPVISISVAPTDNQLFATGETITIEGNITDDVGIGGIYVGLVKVSQNLTDAEVDHLNTVSLFHEHHFDNHKDVDFKASIVVGADKDNDHPTPKDITGNLAWETADYYLIVKSPNAFGGGAAISKRYNIKIEL
jgi:hypothetical protein